MGEGEALVLIDSLAALRPPALLMSGGEPLAHPNFFSYLSNARSHDINVSISTNGTLIDRGTAKKIVELGVSYVGVSVDGVGAANDAFRGMSGAFRGAVNAIESLAENGCRVGLRVTLASPVLAHLDSIFDAASRLPLSRICFYHFIPAGRGALDSSLMPDAEEERRALGAIIAWTEKLNAARRNAPIEILTVGDASDGVFLYKYLLERDPARAGAARSLLERSSSRGAGPGILSIRWDGTVFSNQFSWNRPLGSWRDLKSLEFGSFSANPRGVPAFDEGISGEPCVWKDICSGSLRDRCTILEEDCCA
jgi:MoaA/NifB/PqqE/SkfB family radical SAM enzyme